MLYSEKVNDLFLSQLNEWELSRLNYSQLNAVKTKIIDFGTFRIFVQFNPQRMRSSAAKVDSKSIESRPCFLCSENRPSDQRGVTFDKNMTILVNPFPIFERHLTVPSEEHKDQRIFLNFETMLLLAEAIPDYIVFYNGPECGASAPDHLHFQAGNKGFLPIEQDFLNGSHTRLLSEKNGVELWLWNNYFRGIVTIKGSDMDALTDIFQGFYQEFSRIQNDKPEPMLNILVSYYQKGWIIHIIPRKVHRPVQFFLEGDDKILLSPASVDLAGVIITPREEDFLKITMDDVAGIFSQVCLDESELPHLFSHIL
jgi:ATP adenylyltransferase/5',5'''-P-1,P-4-tetraphosphate phosphorylase II